MKKYTLEHFQKIAKQKKGVCLSKKYINIKTHLRWKCEKNHIWKAIPEVIQRGSWCPDCAGSNHKLKSKVGQTRYTKEIARIIKNKNGYLVSPTIIQSSIQPIFVECKAHGKFKTTSNLIKDGAWCLKCGFVQTANKKRIPYKEVVSLIRSKKATLHTTEKEYHLNHGRVAITCKNGHRWSPLSRDIISRGFWCAKCAQLKNDAEKRLDIKVLQKLAAERGGKLLSKTYTNTTTKLEWKCLVEHHWHSVAGSVLGSKGTNGTWCPYCKHTSRSEAICRIYLETMFQKKFNKCRPEWLTGKKGVPLELDGYCEELNLAFEHQGTQHYEGNFRFFSKSTKGLKERDQLKRKLCKKRGVSLIEVPALNTRLPFNQLENFLLTEIEKYGLSKKLMPYELNSKIFKNVWAPRHNEVLKEAHAIALSRKGKCLSTEYINSRTTLLWKCRKGHQWSKLLYDIRAGSWCPECSPNRKYNANLKRVKNEKNKTI